MNIYGTLQPKNNVNGGINVASIGGGGGTSDFDVKIIPYDERITENTNNINKLENDFNDVNTAIENHTEQISTLQEDTSYLEEEVELHNTNINNLNTSVNNISQTVSQIPINSLVKKGGEFEQTEGIPRDADLLNGELPTYYATSEELNDLADIVDKNTTNINQLNQSLANLGNTEYLGSVSYTNETISVKNLNNFKFLFVVFYAGDNTRTTPMTIPISLFKEFTSGNGLGGSYAEFIGFIKYVSDTSIICTYKSTTFERIDIYGIF